jgi:hypothetical protein
MKFTLLLFSALSLAANAANLVEDHAFGQLGWAIKTTFPLEDYFWEKSHWNLTPRPDLYNPGAVKGPRSNDKCDFYLKAGQTLTQEISGLIKETPSD